MVLSARYITRPDLDEIVDFEAQSRGLLFSLSTLRSAGCPATTQDSLAACWLGFGRRLFAARAPFREFQEVIVPPSSRARLSLTHNV
jgi:hypothetical protein